MTRRTLRAAAILLALASPALAAFAGRPLAEALRALEARGMKIIFSDDVVTPEMIVRQEPASTEPGRILDELLAEHRLRVQRGPRGTLIVVRDTRTKEGTTVPPPPMPVALAEITVTPSRFTLGDDPSGRALLDRDDIRRMAHIADDVFRAIARLPGTAGPDVSARFNLRGGEEDEVQVLLDGAEIWDPFHMKDLFRAFSVIDAETIGSADVFSGGFPAQYGGRSSGVIELETQRPAATGGEAGLGLLQARALSRGTFGGGRGAWLVSARYGYIREMIELVESGDELDPRYGDLLGKVEWTFGDAMIGSLHVLSSSDRLRMHEDPGSRIDASYEDTYVWARLRGAAAPRLWIESVLSAGSLERDRHGSFDTPGFQSGAVEDARAARFLAWRNDAQLDLTPRNLLEGGFVAKSVEARYDYEGSALIEQATHNLGAPPRRIERSVHVRPDGHEITAWVADRMLLRDDLVLEAGIRAESESYTPDGTRVTPRLNLAWSISPRTRLRAGWGLVDQAQRIDELRVEDGVAAFAEARRAEHRAIAFERELGGIAAKLDLYEKRLTRLQPRFENLYDRVLLIPELRADRVRVDTDRGRARGAELLLRAGGDRLSGWFGYTYARVTDTIDGREVPRAWDQRQAITASLDWRNASGWSVNFGGTYRTGWPTTPVLARVEEGRLVSEPGPLRSERLPSYRRIDVRVARAVGDWSYFVEVFNVLGSSALRIDHFRYVTRPGGMVVAEPVSDGVLRFVPSFGITRRW